MVVKLITRISRVDGEPTESRLSEELGVFVNQKDERTLYSQRSRMTSSGAT